MSRTSIISSVAVVVLTLAVGTAALMLHPLRAERVAVGGGKSVETVDVAAVRAQEIAFYEDRAKADPWSAGDQMILAQLFMQRARENGSHEDILRAERAARRSLELREAYNDRAYGVLALSLLEQHRFTEALEAMEQLVAAEPESAAFRASLGEILLELGDYDRAETIFSSLEPKRGHLDVAPRLARWLELTGQTGEALALLYEARDQAMLQTSLPAEAIAWFHLRVGDLELRNGRRDKAEEAFRTGLTILPGDYRLLSAMARLSAARGDWEESIRHGEEVLAKLLDPATLVLLSEVHAAKADTAEAEEYADVLKVAIQSQDGILHRQWSLFLLDRGESIAEILAQSEADVAERADIYGYDVLAWALHKAGKNDEARQAMTQALRLGTQDPMLFFHSGMIERALGNSDRAEAQMQRALEINPYFHPQHAVTAQSAQSTGGRIAMWMRRIGF